MNRLLKISLLCVSFQVGNVSNYLSASDVFGFESSDVRWNAITDSFDQAYGQDPNAIGIVRMVLIPCVLEDISMFLWQCFHHKTISRAMNAAQLYQGMLKQSQINIPEEAALFDKNLGIHLLIVNVLQELQAQSELWNKILTLAERIDQEFLAQIASQGIPPQKDFNVYKKWLGEDIFNECIQNAISNNEQEYLDLIKLMYENVDPIENFDDIFLDTEFDLDIAELAQAPHWYDNFIEQFIKNSNLKEDLYPTFYKLFAYIKDSRISNILQVYKDLPEEDKDFYAECLNDEISDFIKAAVVVENLSDFE